jgi:hypothetical protein
MVETGRHVGHTLADLARSTIAIAPGAPPAPAQPEPDSEVRGDGAVVPLTGSVDDEQEEPEIGQNLAAPNPPGDEALDMATPSDSPAPAPPPPPPPPPEVPEVQRRPRGQAVPSWHRAEARAVAVEPLTADRPMIYSKSVEPASASTHAGAGVAGPRPRIYPRWWKRILSFVTLAILVGLMGLAAGAAIGAGLTFVYRLIQGAV